jgi:hypothetical protein
MGFSSSATYKKFLQEKGLVDFPFDFWIANDKKWILQRFERFNIVGEEFCMIQRIGVDEDVSKRRKVIEDCATVLDSHCSPPNMLHIMFDSTNEDVHTGQSLGVLVEEGPVPENDHRSEILLEEIFLKYQQGAEKLHRDLAAISLGKNLWHLKTWGANNVAIVKIHCGECVKDFGGTSDAHIIKSLVTSSQISKNTICTLFNTFVIFVDAKVSLTRNTLSLWLCGERLS